MHKSIYLMKRAVFKLFPHLMKSTDYVEWLKYHNIQVGEGTYFFGPASTEVDIQRPWMLHIGKYCKITSGVKILCHDYSRSVLRRVYGDIVGEAGYTYIGDNVFIGMNSIILMGSHIGNNVIIGAGSVVSGNIPDNSVVGGIPAKVIRPLDEHYKIRKERTLSEAGLYISCYEKMYKHLPSESEMGPFWQLFMSRDISELREKGIFTALSGDNESEILDAFLSTKQVFNSVEDLKCLNYIEYD